MNYALRSGAEKDGCLIFPERIKSQAVHGMVFKGKDGSGERMDLSAIRNGPPVAMQTRAVMAFRSRPIMRGAS